MPRRKYSSCRGNKFKELQQALRRLSKMKANSRRSALHHSNDAFIRQLSSAVKQVLSKTVPNKVRTSLIKHRAALRALANPQINVASKRQVVARQKGGFFGAILASLAAPLIGNLVKGVMGHLGRR